VFVRRGRMDARPGGAVDLLILHQCNLIQHRYVDDELIFARSVKRVTRAVPGTGATTLAVMKYCLTAKHGGEERHGELMSHDDFPAIQVHRSASDAAKMTRVVNQPNRLISREFLLSPMMKGLFVINMMSSMSGGVENP
jgi:hypothetical protein